MTESEHVAYNSLLETYGKAAYQRYLDYLYQQKKYHNTKPLNMERWLKEVSRG